MCNFILIQIFLFCFYFHLEAKKLFQNYVHSAKIVFTQTLFKAAGYNHFPLHFVFVIYVYFILN